MLRNIPSLMLINTKATSLFLLEVLRKPHVLKDHLINAQQHLVEVSSTNGSTVMSEQVQLLEVEPIASAPYMFV